MLPLQLFGLGLAGRALLLKYNYGTFPNQSRLQYVRRPPTLRIRKAYTAVNPLKLLARSISSGLYRIANKKPNEDYHAVVKSFLPQNAQLLKPRYPLYAGTIQFADLDGDSKNELIASYKLGEGIKTLILKKIDNRWDKIAEINYPGNYSIDYINAVDITGSRKKDLLVGLGSEGKAATLYGFTYGNGSMNKIFNRDYHRLDVINLPKNRNSASLPQFAFWKKLDDNSLDIQLMRWNGSALEPIDNVVPYYRNSVVPYYVQKIKMAPNTPKNWYYLADSLVKAKMYRDALVAIDIGMSLDSQSAYKDKFAALKNMIAQ